MHLHIYDLKVKLGELENYLFTVVSINKKKWKKTVNVSHFILFKFFCSLPVFTSSKPLQMTIWDNQCDRVYEVNLQIYAILKPFYKKSQL